MTSMGRVLLSHRTWLVFGVLVLLVGVSLNTRSVSANHPVFVEGNCDSPVTFTNLVHPGSCGDFDGDGRIGTAEDTDGADRIFGTLRAALGPGTGAAAGTGANYNGTITIMASGRFAETLFIGNSGIVVGEGTATPGNVTIEAAPGVLANINAVLQGDTVANNNVRQGAIGIQIAYINADRRVVLRNLTISNYATGVQAELEARVTIDNCRFENNMNYGIFATGNSRLGVFDSRVSATGFRVGSAGGGAAPGHAIAFDTTAEGDISHTHLTGNFGAAISNASLGPVTYYEVFLGQNLVGPFLGVVTRNNTP